MNNNTGKGTKNGQYSQKREKSPIPLRRKEDNVLFNLDNRNNNSFTRTGGGQMLSNTH